ncbi:MAG: histidine kinase, partial [Planctomycetales bacterium]
MSSVFRLVDWFLPPSMGRHDSLTVQKSRLVVAFTVVSTIWGPIYAALLYGMLDLPRLGHVAVFGVAMSVLVLGALRKTGSFVLAGNLFAAALFVEITWALLLMGGVSSSSILWALLIPIMVTFLAGRISGIAWTAVTISSTLLLFSLESAGVAFPSILTAEQGELLRMVSLIALQIVFLSLCLCHELIQRQAENELELEQEALRELYKSQEIEKKLIAFDIHDGLAQQLVGAMMQLDAGLNQLPESAPAMVALERSRRLLSESVQEARRLIAGIRPPELDEFGLVAAMEYLVEGVRRQHGVNIAL